MCENEKKGVEEMCETDKEIRKGMLDGNENGDSRKKELSDNNLKIKESSQQSLSRLVNPFSKNWESLNSPIAFLSTIVRLYMTFSTIIFLVHSPTHFSEQTIYTNTQLDRPRPDSCTHHDIKLQLLD